LTTRTKPSYWSSPFQQLCCSLWVYLISDFKLIPKVYGFLMIVKDTKKKCTSMTILERFSELNRSWWLKYSFLLNDRKMIKRKISFKNLIFMHYISYKRSLTKRFIKAKAKTLLFKICATNLSMLKAVIIQVQLIFI
jgi:hypothetical protein